MHITVLVGLSVLLVVSLANGYAVQDDEDEMNFVGRELSEFSGAEAVFFLTETLREMDQDDEDVLSSRHAQPSAAQIAKMKAYCQQNPKNCQKGKAKCQKNPQACIAKAQQACKGSSNPACQLVPTS